MVTGAEVAVAVVGVSGSSSKVEADIAHSSSSTQFIGAVVAVVVAAVAPGGGGGGYTLI